MDDYNTFTGHRAPTARRPLLGMTVLAVEDSRFACEAFRLLCLRSGARIRRADSLRSAQKHLKVYRPTVAIIDIGLPDGSGIELIRELSNSHPRIQVILGTSGDVDGKPRALAAGANDFLHKPIANISTFQALVLKHLPPEHQPVGPRPVSDERIEPDAIALQDDLSHVQEILCRDMKTADVAYVTQFARGLAKSASDRALENAVELLARHNAERRDLRADITLLRNMIADRLSVNVAI